MILLEYEVAALERLVRAGPAGLTGDALARLVFHGEAGAVLFERVGGTLVKATWRFTRLAEAGLVEVDRRNGRYRVTAAGELALKAAPVDVQSGESFAAVCERRGFSVRDAAQRCGVSRATVRRWLDLGTAPDGMAARLEAPKVNVIAVPSWALPGGRRGAR